MSEFEGDGSPSSGGGLRRGRVGGISSGQMADMLSEPTGDLLIYLREWPL